VGVQALAAAAEQVGSKSEAVREVAEKLEKEGKPALQDVRKAVHHQSEAVQAAAAPVGDKAKEGLLVSSDSLLCRI
jgi:ElaB/YqjD/DUF883 family membrane-anchored ribosome-binding protein